MTYAQVFVRGHHLFQEANSFPAKLRLLCLLSFKHFQLRNARRFENTRIINCKGNAECGNKEIMKGSNL